MQSISIQVLALFAGSVIGQLVALGLLPRTQGFANPVMTVVCLAFFVFSIWMIARLVHSGVNLSLLMPILAAVIPLGTIAIGVLVYGDNPSLGRIALLVAACGLIGLASRVS